MDALSKGSSKEEGQWPSFNSEPVLNFTVQAQNRWPCIVCDDCQLARAGMIKQECVCLLDVNIASVLVEGIRQTSLHLDRVPCPFFAKLNIDVYFLALRQTRASQEVT